jgi:hypothetical protein
MASSTRGSDHPPVGGASKHPSFGAGPGTLIRADRVAEVRRRLAGGYYHAVLVRRKIADGVDRVLKGFDRI